MLRYMILIFMWPGKEQRQYALNKITDFMGFDLKEIQKRDESTSRAKVHIYIVILYNEAFTFL